MKRKFLEPLALSLAGLLSTADARIFLKKYDPQLPLIVSVSEASKAEPLFVLQPADGSADGDLYAGHRSHSSHSSHRSHSSHSSHYSGSHSSHYSGNYTSGAVAPKPAPKPAPKAVEPNIDSIVAAKVDSVLEQREKSKKGNH